MEATFYMQELEDNGFLVLFGIFGCPANYRLFTVSNFLVFLCAA